MSQFQRFASKRSSQIPALKEERQGASKQAATSVGRRRTFGTESGNAILEFAIGSLLIVTIFTSLYQYGFTFLQYNTLENAVIRGARYAALVPYDSQSETFTTAFGNAVKNMVVYGTPTAGSSPVLLNLTTSNVVLTVSFEPYKVPTTMTVKITGYTISSLFGSTTLTNKPSITFPYQGIWSPI